MVNPVYTPPPVAPPVASPSGLLSIAALMDVDRPVIYGVDVNVEAVGGHGLWGMPVCEPGERRKERGEVESSSHFPGTAVWAAAGCKSVGYSEEDARAESQRRFRAIEGSDLEVFTAEVLADRAVETAGDLPTVEATFRAEGINPVLHVRPSDVPALIRAKCLTVVAGSVRTLLGGQVAIGAGYQTAFPAGTAYFTGVVTIYRNSVETYVAFDRETNERLAVTERPSAVTWTSQTLAVSIPTEEGNTDG